MGDISQSPYLTLREAAAYIRMNPEVLRRKVLEKKVKVGRAGRKLLFTIDWLRSFIERGGQ